MGNTTIIELNHDCADEIEKNPQAFVECVLEQLKQGTWAGRTIPGGRIIQWFDRADRAGADSGINLDWAHFKAKWAAARSRIPWTQWTHL